MIVGGRVRRWRRARSEVRLPVETPISGPADVAPLIVRQIHPKHLLNGLRWTAAVCISMLDCGPAKYNVPGLTLVSGLAGEPRAEKRTIFWFQIFF